jgi:NADPH:quinone reductase-like Zn-dependent oxidoreductase
MTKTRFRPGDRVWFTNKFGDRVSGTYVAVHTVPGIDCLVRGHIVVSRNAFGCPSQKPTTCFVTDDKLHLDEYPDPSLFCVDRVYH